MVAIARRRHQRRARTGQGRHRCGHGNGTDVAMNSAQVTLVKETCAASRARAISTATIHNMWQNLGFAQSTTHLACRLRRASCIRSPAGCCRR